MTPAQLAYHFALLAKLNVTTDAERYNLYSHLSDRRVTSVRQLTAAEFDRVVKHLDAVQGWEPGERDAERAILVGRVRAEVA